MLILKLIELAPVISYLVSTIYLRSCVFPVLVLRISVAVRELRYGAASGLPTSHEVCRVDDLSLQEVYTSLHHRKPLIVIALSLSNVLQRDTILK